MGRNAAERCETRAASGAQLFEPLHGSRVSRAAGYWESLGDFNKVAFTLEKGLTARMKGWATTGTRKPRLPPYRMIVLLLTQPNSESSASSRAREIMPGRWRFCNRRWV